MTDTELKELGALIGELPAKPRSYSYEGQVRPKSTSYVGDHVYSICGGPMRHTAPEKHHCIGSVLAKDEDTAARLARLIEAAPDLLTEVVRLRAALARLADDEEVTKWIESASQYGRTGAGVAYGDVQAFARAVLRGG